MTRESLKSELLKKEFLTLQQTFLKRLILLADSLIFLQAAFILAEKEKEKNTELSQSIIELKKCMPKELTAMESGEIKDYQLLFISMLFLQLVTQIELFLVDVISCIAKKYPKKIGSVTLKLSEIVDLEDKDRIIEKACSDYLNDLMYKKPNEYKKEIVEIISCKKDLLDDVWPHFVEMKARRDIALHNGWIANETYKRKVSEVSINDNINVGDSLYPTVDYYFKSHDYCKEIVNTISEHLLNKFT